MPESIRAASSRTRLLVLSYVGFISLGLPDTVLGAAWPAMRGDFGLGVEAAGSIVLVTTAGVVLSSMSTGAVVLRWGTAAVLVTSTVLAAVALFANSAAPSFAYLLAAGLCAGLGGGAIDATLNDYMARHHSARHMNWLHASWGVGAAFGPLVVSTVLASGASWRLAYVLLGVIELGLVLAFWTSRRWWSGDSAVAAAPTEATTPRANAAWARRASVLMFFAYGGLEAGTGLWASSLLIETRGTTLAIASASVAVYWGALCVGRFAIGAKAEEWGPARVLRASVSAALVAVIVLAIPGTSAVVFIAALAALGVALAPIYPLAMHDTPRRFGSDDGARLVGYQVAAASLGIAVLPWAVGAIAASTALTLLPALLCVLGVLVVALERARARAV